MEPFWADPGHSCPYCGAGDIGLNPDNCRCGPVGMTGFTTDHHFYQSSHRLGVVDIIGMIIICFTSGAAAIWTGWQIGILIQLLMK
jgi:hypothetical protein